MSEERGKPAYYFKALLSTGKNWSTELPCKIFLPRSPAEDPHLELRPTEEQFYSLTRLRTCSLFGRVGDDRNHTSFEVKELHLGNARHTSWGSELSEFIVGVDARDLMISEVREISESDQSGAYIVSFQLTPSRVLRPFGLRTFFRSGGFKIEYPSKDQLAVELKPDFLVVFKHHYSSRVEENGAVVQEPRLVAECELAGSPVDFDSSNAILLLDDFLLLASFAERQRCALRGWILESPGRQISFYRSDRFVPKYDPSHTRNEYLINDLDVEEFLQNTPAVFRDHPFRALLRSALEAITCESSTIGEDLLRYFSAVETALLVFRRQNDLEYVLNTKQERTAFVSDLKEFVCGHELFRGDEREMKKRRALLYENLQGLNRVSLGTAFLRFAESYRVSFEDLWPVISNGPLWSLATIRNKIVHGESFTEKQWWDISLAAEHTRWIAERMLLSLLEWSPQRSRVNSFYAEEMARLNDWIAARERLSES